MDHTGKHNLEYSSRTDALILISEALMRLHYGAIQLTVHNGKIMQIDVTEKLRPAT